MTLQTLSVLFWGEYHCLHFDEFFRAFTNAPDALIFNDIFRVIVRITVVAIDCRGAFKTKWCWRLFALPQIFHGAQLQGIAVIYFVKHGAAVTDLLFCFELQFVRVNGRFDF